MSKFCTFRLMQREPYNTMEAELPHAAGRLFQQYIVDAFAKVVNTRLDWIVRNQRQLRMDSVRGLMDYLAEAPSQD
eukprot:3253590-Pyramimonas_sp.AAC.1